MWTTKINFLLTNKLKLTSQKISYVKYKMLHIKDGNSINTSKSNFNLQLITVPPHSAFVQLTSALSIEYNSNHKMI